MVVLALAVGGCMHANAPSADEMSRDTAKLEETALPTMAELRVNFYRDDGGCQLVDYGRGVFSSPADSEGNCVLADSPSRPFDEVAAGDFERMRQAFRDSLANTISLAEFQYGPASDLIAALVLWEPGAFDEFSYIYDRAEAYSKEADPDTIAVNRINERWWFFSRERTRW